MILLRFIYWLFEKQFNKIYFSKQSKKKSFSNLIKAFVDSNGKAYYTWKDDFEMPITRMKEVQKIIYKIKSGLSDENLKRIIEEIKLAINKGNKPDIARVGFLVTEMEARQEIVIDQNALYHLTAIVYVREDEDLAVLNDSITNEKIEQFKKDSSGGLYDFFYNRGILDYIPYMKKSEEEWNTYFQECNVKIQALNKFLESTTKQK